MASQTVENYLKALFYLCDKNDEVSISELSNQLEVSKPSVNSMVKTLSQEGLIKYEKYKPLKITEKGRIEASKIIRKHRLTEMFLVKKMGFAWDEVHEVAEQIEHINSPLFFDRMDELLDFPKFDPHGSPIPDKSGQIEDKSYLKLTDCKVDDKVILKSLNHTSKVFLNFLDQKKISLNTIFEIKHIEDFDDSVTVHYSENRLEIFSQKVCDRLLVEKIITD